MLTLCGPIEVLWRDVLIGYLNIDSTGYITSTRLDRLENFHCTFWFKPTVDELIMSRALPWWVPKSYAKGYFSSQMGEFIYYRGRSDRDEVWLRNSGDPITYGDLEPILTNSSDLFDMINY